MMKKILNEWRRFRLTEAQSNQDQELGAPDGWFETWNRHMGPIDFLPAYRKIMRPSLRSLQRMKFNPDLTQAQKKEIDKIYSRVSSGFTFYSNDQFLAESVPSMEEIVNIKLNYYFEDPSVPQEHKDFFRDNYEAIMDYGETTMAPSRFVHGTGATFKGLTGFKGSMQDFYMFGGGFGATRQIMDSYFADMERGPSTINPQPVDLGRGSDEFEAEQREKADFFNSFFDDQEKQKAQRRRRK